MKRDRKKTYPERNKFDHFQQLLMWDPCIGDPAKEATSKFPTPFGLNLLTY